MQRFTVVDAEMMDMDPWLDTVCSADWYADATEAYDAAEAAPYTGQTYMVQGRHWYPAVYENGNLAWIVCNA